MKLGNLKKVRVAVSLTFLVLTGWSFLDIYYATPPSWMTTILFLQFTPSLLKFLTLLSFSAAGFLIALLATILFGRVYCSTVCPLGTLQDLVTFAARKLLSKKYHRPQKPFHVIRHGLLSFTVLTALGGSLTIVNLLDPLSSFGRILSNVARPVLASAHNVLAFALESVNLYTLYPVPVKALALASIAVPGLTLAILVWMSFRHGRLYCNTICPLGAFLGLLSNFSVYRITVNKDHCIGCNLCEQACKSGCIDKKLKVLDFTRCVGCYNCLAVCPSNGLEFQNILARKTSSGMEKTDFKRREMLYNSGMLITAAFGTTQTGMKKIISSKDSTVAVVKTMPLAAPGGRSIEHFTARCTACHLCVSACPSQVLSPSFLEYGLAGIMQPRMDYNEGFCNYECVACSQVCPSGAILPITQEEKKLTQIGAAKFVKDNCIAYTEEKDCGACSEHCPTKAVRMVPYKKTVAPEVKEEYCIGCGACEHACPTMPFKAIYVDGKAVHSFAKKPEVKKLDEKQLKEEFPF